MMTAEPAQLLAQAFAAFSAYRWNETIELCRRILAGEPDHHQAHLLWASAELHGSHYHQTIERIHRHLRPGTYVEIGIAAGDTLAMAAAGTTVIGIDPNPRLSYPVRQGMRIFSTTSDEFFAQHDLCAELGGRPLDLSFIDGMHLFEFALRDFVNLEQYCGPSSTCLVHDCYPLDARTSDRDRTTRFWTGDVWKLILCLKKYRPDLDIHTVAAAPTGLAVIRRLDPKSRILRDRLDHICEEFVALPYSVLHGDKPAQLNMVQNNWLSVKALLRTEGSMPIPLR